MNHCDKNKNHYKCNIIIKIIYSIIYYFELGTYIKINKMLLNTKIVIYWKTSLFYLYNNNI